MRGSRSETVKHNESLDDALVAQTLGVNYRKAKSSVSISNDSKQGVGKVKILALQNFQGFNSFKADI